MLRGGMVSLAKRAKAVARETTQAVLLRATRAVVEAERGRWPRDSGQSAAQLAVERTGDGVRIIGRARYTTAIVSRGRRPWYDLVARLDLAVRREIPRAAGTELLRKLGRGG